MPAITTNRGVLYNLRLNRESASLLRDGLELLPQEKKTTVMYRDLIKSLNTVLVVMDRTIKNEILIQEQKRKDAQTKRTKKPLQGSHQQSS